MSITIHFKGKIRPLSKIESLADSLKSIADELGWEYKIFDEDFSQPIALKGITLRPHPKSEWLNILFDKNGELNNTVRVQFEQVEKKNRYGKWNFIKTQFAPIHIHIAVVKILRFIQSKYIPNLKVVDEGGYWETGDLEGLDERRENLNNIMDILDEKLKNIRIPKNSNNKEGEITDLIERVIRREVLPELKKRRKK